MTQPPPYQAPGHAGPPPAFTCPKCSGPMRTYNRNGVHIEQCDSCRGVFLDFGELENLLQLENRFVQQPPPPNYGPGWGNHGGHHYRRKGFGGLFFSS